MARARISRSLASSACPAVMVPVTPISPAISWARALTSHGCPCVSSNTRSTASLVNSCPVASVCRPYSSPIWSAVKSPRRSDLVTMLNGLIGFDRSASPPQATL